jgi:hypothetical protein
MKRILIAICVVGLLAFACIRLLIYLGDRDTPWREISSPNYRKDSSKLGMDLLFEPYKRDMSLRPEYQGLVPVIAQRGRLAAEFMISRIQTSPSENDVRISVIIFDEMKRTGSFNICTEPPMLRSLQATARRYYPNDRVYGFGRIIRLCSS